MKFIQVTSDAETYINVNHITGLQASEDCGTYIILQGATGSLQVTESVEEIMQLIRASVHN